MEHGKRKGDDVSSDPIGKNEKKGMGSTRKITPDRLWNKRPDDITFKMPTKTKSGVIWLMEFRRMSDITNRYVIRTKCVVEGQYTSFRSDLKKNLEFFKVPNASMESIRSKLVMKCLMNMQIY